MKQRMKKILLTLSSGLALTGISASVMTVATSCSTEFNTTAYFNSIIGKYISFGYRDYESFYSGILVKVEREKIWLDTWYTANYKNEKTLISFDLPLVINTLGFYPYFYGTPEKIIEILEEIRESMLDIDYLLVLREFQNFLQNTTTLKVRTMILDAFKTFETHMMDWTVEKIDDAISDVRKNYSMKKWKELTSYYINTFVWNREHIIDKLNYIEKVYSIPTPDPLKRQLNNVFSSIGVAMTYYGNHIDLLPK